MEGPGQKLKRARERLGLTYRDVEQASQAIADRHKNDDFIVVISRLSEIENHDKVPSMYKLYTLCAVYRLDFDEAMEWYGVNRATLAGDAASIALQRTHLLGFKPGEAGEVQFPLSLDPGVDIKRTTFLSRMVQKWGKLPLMLLSGVDLRDHRYGFIGTDDRFMFPLIQPGSLVLIDENRRKVADSGWTDEWDRPIYFFEHRNGYACAWCTLDGSRLVLQPHPSSPCGSISYEYPSQIDVVGQLTGVAMLLDQAKRVRARV